MIAKKIGFIGLGKMGIPMAQNLIKAGYQLSVYNRSEAKAEKLIAEGAVLVHSPLAVLQQSEIVILMVADDAAIESIFTGKNGLLTQTLNDKIIINMSTVSAAISIKMDDLLAKNGNEYVDAPVSGSLKQATEGSLVIMAGGKQKTFDKVKPIFDCLGKLSIWLGPTGSGNSAKLAINALLSFQAQGLAEAVIFANNQGIETSALLELIHHSALGNVFMKIKGDAILQQNFDAVFALKHIAKDLRLANEAGMSSPLAKTALKTFDAAENKLGDEDIISIIKDLNK
ncbi:MAG: NAD(P)-dependent oxidoreductase [Pedobacter sp.]|nr:MAG: NAD(P)-dependent oxidoreductase [Pedobacter sp.]